MPSFRLHFFIIGDKFTGDEETIKEYEAEDLEDLARKAYIDYWRPLSNLASGTRKVGVLFERKPCKYFQMTGWQDGEPIDEDTLYEVFYYERIHRHQKSGIMERMFELALKNRASKPAESQKEQRKGC